MSGMRGRARGGDGQKGKDPARFEGTGERAPEPEKQTEAEADVLPSADGEAGDGDLVFNSDALRTFCSHIELNSLPRTAHIAWGGENMKALAGLFTDGGHVTEIVDGFAGVHWQNARTLDYIYRDFIDELKRTILAYEDAEDSNVVDLSGLEGVLSRGLDSYTPGGGDPGAGAIPVDSDESLPVTDGTA